VHLRAFIVGIRASCVPDEEGNMYDKRRSPFIRPLPAIFQRRNPCTKETKSKLGIRTRWPSSRKCQKGSKAKEIKWRLEIHAVRIPAGDDTIETVTRRSSRLRPHACGRSRLAHADSGVYVPGFFFPQLDTPNRSPPVPVYRTDLTGYR